MLQYYNQVGIVKNNSIWKPAYYTLSLAYNMSDSSKKLAKVKSFTLHTKDKGKNHVLSV